MGRGKGTSLNSTCLTPKPLASSVYVHVPEAPSPRKRAISVMSLFPSPERYPAHEVVKPGRKALRSVSSLEIGGLPEHAGKAIMSVRTDQRGSRGGTLPGLVGRHTPGASSWSSRNTSNVERAATAICTT